MSIEINEAKLVSGLYYLAILGCVCTVCVCVCVCVLCCLGLVPAKGHGYLEEQMREDPWLMDPKYTFTQEDKAKMPVYADGKQLSPLAMK